MSGHSATAGTGHRGNVITSMHGLPMTFTPVQEAMNQTPACPDWLDYREHVDGTMAHKASPVHRIYAQGKVVAQLPAASYESAHGKQSYRDARAIERIYKDRARVLGLDPAEVTLDQWLPGEAISDHTTTRFDARPVDDTPGDEWELVSINALDAREEDVGHDPTDEWIDAIDAA